MKEFQELVKDAPKFASMERGELVECAYAMYASGVKTDAENEKLRDTITHLEAEKRELMKRLASLDSTYEVLTDFNGDLEQECADLMAENAKLRAARDVWQENDAKLRELVRDMYAVMVEDAANCDVTYPEQFDNRMRELGIEVDG